ncbi:hypothetical protein [Vibrio sp. 10N.222.55.C12]|uniref:hypothetical protein n=1 Tax=Vibrio sp. 10N.222.55.C12 TaxID=1884470 RepID=UPI000C836325|nr:hypothetical protein [Vibrio sp. 10N.222.55.C12]PMN96607.1 hypothetical protein BCT20_02260 [Vibrio sp. 10N.222.55.C12]
MSDKKFESVLLEANVRLNFLQFIVKVGIASDHEHSDFLVDIDVATKLLTIRSHVAAHSGIVGHYEWPIRHTNLTAPCRLTLPAQGLVNILMRFDRHDPLWLVIESDREVHWAAYQEEATPQLEFFDDAYSEPLFERSHEITYGMQVKADAPFSQYHLPAVAPIISFQVVAIELAQLFKLINQLTQENNANASKEVILILELRESAPPVLTVYAMKHTWSCALEVPVLFERPEPVGFYEARLSIRHASHLAGLLSVIAEQVIVTLTHTHLIFQKRGWQCSFTLAASPSWDGQTFMSNWLNLPKAQCYPLKTEKLSRLVRQLNIANDEKRARLVVARQPNESGYHFRVNQDRVSADLDLELDTSFYPLSFPMSLSLWSFNTLLESLGDEVYWYVCPERMAVLIADLQCRRHVVLLAKSEGEPLR